MTTSTFPAFPVDDSALNQVEHALRTRLGEKDENGNRQKVGGEFTMSQLLNFYSGYDPSKIKPLDGLDLEDSSVVEYTGGPVYHRDDVILAYLHEIRRLRALLEQEKVGTLRRLIRKLRHKIRVGNRMSNKTENLFPLGES